MKTTVSKLAKLPVIAAIRRYWVLFTLLALCGGLLLSNLLWPVFGAFLWVPALSLGAVGTALLIRNVFNSKTSDLDADSGRFEREWHDLDSRTRVILTVVQLSVYILAAAIVAAAIACRG